MSTETDVGKIITREVNTRVRRLAVIGFLANAAVALALWGAVTAKADADIRQEIGKISESYLRRESAALQGVASEGKKEVERVQAALMEKVLESERIAMALDAQKVSKDRHRAESLTRTSVRRAAPAEY